MPLMDIRGINIMLPGSWLQHTLGLGQRDAAACRCVPKCGPRRFGIVDSVSCTGSMHAGTLNAAGCQCHAHLMILLVAGGPQYCSVLVCL